MRLYHATKAENLGSILASGIKPSPEGIVYMCDNQQWAATFLAMRHIKNIIVFEVSIDKRKIFETYDHNPLVFKTKCFGYFGTIHPSKIKNIIKYEL